MIHICYITAEYPIKNLPHGGIGTFTRTLAYKLVEKNIQVSIIRLSNIKIDEIIDDNGITVYLVPEEKKLPLKFLINSFRINIIIEKIHLKSPISIIETPELGLAFIKKQPEIKYLIRMHGGHHFFAKAENRPTEWRKVWQEKKSFAKADHIIAVSKYVANQTRTLLNLGLKNIEIIYNPINTEKFYQSDISKMETFSVFFAGTIVEKKGIRQLIQAIELLIDEFPNIILNIAGRDSNIPGTNKQYRPYLESFISNKIKSKINFLGVIPNNEVATYIEKSHVCCYPSHMEAMPLAWLEVLAMGKIFIGSETGPGPEAVEDKITGFLVNPFDPKDIADKLRYVFLNPIESNLIAINARESIFKKFDLKVLIDTNIKFYKSILK